MSSHDDIERRKLIVQLEKVRRDSEIHLETHNDLIRIMDENLAKDKKELAALEAVALKGDKNAAIKAKVSKQFIKRAEKRRADTLKKRNKAQKMHDEINQRLAKLKSH